MKLLLPNVLLLLTVSSLHAQIGGLHTYEFMNLSPSARITALGGNLITVRGDDANLALGNPAALNELMHQQISVNHSFHVAGISHGYASYAHHLEGPGLTSHLGVQYVSYGDFTETNDRGQEIGTFQASE
ncbi:MAG: hypothetical protein GVY26_03630, partial [Bacteroidetes bacterium]|nr:hypothetical protein [Bacteroidota bacterium]